MEALILPNTQSLLEVYYFLTLISHYMKTHKAFITASGMSKHSYMKYEDILINEKPHIKQRSHKNVMLLKISYQ